MHLGRILNLSLKLLTRHVKGSIKDKNIDDVTGILILIIKYD
jgi:hypothetical protein